jgi:hypothetical protein
LSQSADGFLDEGLDAFADSSTPGAAQALGAVLGGGAHQ